MSSVRDAGRCGFALVAHSILVPSIPAEPEDAARLCGGNVVRTPNLTDPEIDHRATRCMRSASARIAHATIVSDPSLDQIRTCDAADRAAMISTL